MLCDGLRAVGHDVTLFAAGGSDDMDLFPICDAPYEAVLPWTTWRGTSELTEYQTEAFATGWYAVRSGDFDVVHNNTLFPDIIDWAARDKIPCVTSHHVPPFETIRTVTQRYIAVPWLRFTVPSAAQHASWQASLHDRLHVVHNGINTASWKPGRQRSGYFVWSGRITPNKGTHFAVHAARLAGASLRIFGPVEDADYFTSQIEPYLSDDVTYCGHRSAQELATEVGSALGVLATPMWDEPFGLVAAEALACGTPVCAFDNGALREVVGSCGLVVPKGDAQALAIAMSNVWRINRDDCRSRAERLFSSEAMIEGYQRLYEEAILVVSQPDQPAIASASNAARTRALLA
ncbi:glycosyltransferase [Erythrobacter sp. R86502]|uniref:glycosyltransferase n=1 Tax=Erythrobacter sp. R86502 TaxID=3093846 RepID=UPI0036D20FC0